MNNWTEITPNQLLGLVQARLGRAIKRHRLRAALRDNEVVLQNQHCRIRMASAFQHRLRLTFCNPRDEFAQDFDLPLYLVAMHAADFSEIFPAPRHDFGPVRVVTFQLELLNALVMEGRMDAPLKGDFSWVGDYDTLQAESLQLAADLRAAADCACEKTQSRIQRIGLRLLVHDLTWILEARALLAERKACLMPP
jgi:hypothetical protein